MHIDDKQLADFAFDSGLVSKTELSQTQKEADKTGLSLGDVLVKNGFLGEDDLRRIYAQLLGVAFVDLKNTNLKIEDLEAIPEPVSRKHNLICLKNGIGEIEVALLEMEDLKAIDYLKKERGLRVVPKFTDKSSIIYALTKYQKLLKKEFGEKIEKEARKISKSSGYFGDEKSSSADLEAVAESEGATKLADLIIKHAIFQDATDIHLDPFENETIVRFRIGGTLREAFSLPKKAHVPLVLRFKYLAEMDLYEDKQSQDGRFKIEDMSSFGESKISFRISTVPTSEGEKLTLRTLCAGSLGFSLEALGFHGAQIETINEALNERSGVIIASGEKNSGKTTTLYTLIDILNKPSVSVSTLENPIEYKLKRVNQTEIKNGDGTLQLRAIMKSNPDVVMVGDISDKDVAELALASSLSGKLLLVPVLSPNAGQAVDILRGAGLENTLVSSVSRIIIGHSLVKKIPPDTPTENLTEQEISELHKLFDMDKVLRCLKEEKVVSRNSGWQDIKVVKNSSDTEDVTGVHEVLKVTPAIKDLILKDASGREIESQAVKEGMLTLSEDCLFKAVQGVTSIDEVFRVASK